MPSVPENEQDHDLACAKQKYFEGHYDVEPIGDDYDDIRAEENFRAFVRGIGG